MRTYTVCLAAVGLMAILQACSDGSSGLTGTTGGSPSASAGTPATGSAGSGAQTGGSGTQDTAGSAAQPVAGSGAVDPGTGGTGGSSEPTTGGAAGTATAGGSAGTPGAGGGSGGAASSVKTGPFKILVMATTLEYPHASIKDCNTLLDALGKAGAPERATIPGLAADATWTVDHMVTDPKATNYFSEITAENLAKYDVFYSNNPTGPVFTNAPDGANKKKIFQTWFLAGGGWAGQHSASDFENNNRWSWFHDTLSGGWFVDHDNADTNGAISAQAQFATHPIVKAFTSPWNAQDEWYKMNRDIESVAGFKVLAKVTVSNSPLGNTRPAVWIKETEKGRGFYTIRGHNPSVYNEPQFRQLMLRGILWSARRLPE